MLTGLDSAYPPNAAQVAQAKAAGYSAWFGYFAGPNILNGWSKADFDRVKAGGLATGAYCSGYADPLAMKAQSLAWSVDIYLDDESGIRSEGLYPTANRALARTMMHGGGPRPVTQRRFLIFGSTISTWVQPWLNASGAGLYGNQPVFAGARAARYVFAAYPGIDPKAPWPSYYPRPADGHPCAWQFQGTHSLFGIGVDATHFDDGFFGLFGGAGGGSATGEEDMLYVGPVHSLNASLKAFAPGSYYAEPFSSAKALGAITSGTVYPVDGYRWSSTPIQSPNLGNGQAGPDSVWWHAKGGGWIPDAYLVTTGLAGAPGPNVPPTEPIAAIYVPTWAGGAYVTPGSGGADDDSQYVTKTDLSNAIGGIKVPTKASIAGPIAVELS